MSKLTLTMINMWDASDTSENAVDNIFTLLKKLEIVDGDCIANVESVTASLSILRESLERYIRSHG